MTSTCPCDHTRCYVDTSQPVSVEHVPCKSVNVTVSISGRCMYDLGSFAGDQSACSTTDHCEANGALYVAVLAVHAVSVMY